MTMSLPSNAFDVASAHPLTRPALPMGDKAGRICAVLVTALVHVAIVLAMLTAVRVAPIKAPPALMVHLEAAKEKPTEDVAPPLQLARPSAITVPTPDVIIQVAPSPVMVQPPVAAPVPPIAAAQKTARETRESFLGRLVVQLNRFKQYPPSARQAHIEGVVMLHFVIAADGRVLSFEIAQSSGRPVLDAEALALIQRAQPLPVLPADFSTRTLDAVVPIVFALQG